MSRRPLLAMRLPLPLLLRRSASCQLAFLQRHTHCVAARPLCVLCVFALPGSPPLHDLPTSHASPPLGWPPLSLLRRRNSQPPGMARPGGQADADRLPKGPISGKAPINGRPVAPGTRRSQTRRSRLSRPSRLPCNGGSPMRHIQTNRISKLASPVFSGHCNSVHARRPQPSICRKKRRSDRSKTPSAMTWAPFSRTSGGSQAAFLQGFPTPAFSDRLKAFRVRCSEYRVQSTAFRRPFVVPPSGGIFPGVLPFP